MPEGPTLVGATLSLICEAPPEDPPVSFSWTGPTGQDVSLTDTDGTISITLFAIGVYGTYTCTATNEFGMTTTTVQAVLAGIIVIMYELKGKKFNPNS